MKELNSIQTRHNQTNNNSLTLKNQKVMKTKKYSISLKALAAVVFAFAFSAFLNAQFVPPFPAINTQTAEEVRANSVVTYSLTTGINPGDSYRWVVVGGVITGGTGSGVAPDSSILVWTVDATSIEVTWNTDITGTPIGSAPGEIYVQKQTGGSCASALQRLDITMWNPATANLDLTGLMTEMCSGDALGFPVPADLTGAPDPVATNFGFDVSWAYAVTTGTLTDLGLVDVNGLSGTEYSNTNQVDIPLPNGLINSGPSDAIFELTLTSMLDDFDEGGSVAASATYVITVHPTPETGEISSVPVPLSRR